MRKCFLCGSSFSDPSKVHLVLICRLSSFLNFSSLNSDSHSCLVCDACFQNFVLKFNFLIEELKKHG